MIYRHALAPSVQLGTRLELVTPYNTQIKHEVLHVSETDPNSFPGCFLPLLPEPSKCRQDPGNELIWLILQGTVDMADFSTGKVKMLTVNNFPCGDV